MHPIAFRRVTCEKNGLRLVVAGPPPDSEELKMVHDLSSRITWYNYPDQEKLKEIYAESMALLYVSKYEGFGMPLVEAMSQGCVPIALNHSSIPEVLQGAGILLQSDGPEEIAQAISRCCNDPDFYQSKVGVGKKRSIDFDWQKCATEVLAFYRSL